MLSSATPAGGSYTAFDPTVVYGTPGSGTALAGNSSVTFQVGGQNGIPSSGLGEVTQDIIVTSPTQSGTLNVYRAGGSDPHHPIVSFLAGDTTDVATTDQIVSQVSPTGQETITNESSGTLHLEVAVRGYFLAPSAPDGPTSVTATASGTSATISWAAPPTDGGSPITGYTITTAPDTAQVTVGPGTFQATLTGLAHTATDTFTVTAANAIGASPGSAYNPVIPVTVEDTVSAGSPLAAGATSTFVVGGTSGLPVYGVGEAALNVTVKNEAASGSLQFTPDNWTTPSPSVTFSPSTPTTSEIFVPAGDGGHITVTNTSSGNIDVTVQLHRLVKRSGSSAASTATRLHLRCRVPRRRC